MGDTVDQVTLSDEALDRVVAAARAAADREGVRVSVATVDAAGRLTRFVHEHGAIHVSIGLAQDKAYTALCFGVPTHAWTGIIKDDLQLRLGIPPLPRHTLLGGGVPLRIFDALVGGLGVSGGNYSQDRSIAEAAAACLQNQG